MPPRYAYWTILVDEQPTAFRAGDREDLQPTFKRLQAKHHAVVALVTRCEALGLVARVSSTVDRREVHVRLTKAGAERLEKLADLHRAELRVLQRDLSLRDLFSGPDGRVR